MWYPPQQQQHHPHQNQQQRWLRYNQHLSSQQHQQSCSTTSYYCTSNEPSTTNRTTNTYVGLRNDENEAFNQYHSNRADDVYVTGADYYVTASTSSYSDEMSSSSLPHQTSNTYWNPIIAAPTKTSLVTTTVNQNPTSSSSMLSTSSSACWDWLLYSPEIYSHLYRPSSSCIQQQIKDEDFDLSTRLPSWLLALLYPSMKQIYSADDENDNDQEISSLHNNNNNNTDESLLSMNIDKNITHVSSNLSLSSENTLNQQKLTQNRSSTPDTDDGYQSASDASRSDYSQQSSLHYDHHNSKNNLNTLMPKRISYAAAAKPLTTSLSNNQTSPLATPIVKMKNNSSSLSSITNDLANASGQKLKFIAPRFERMHHAKQYPSSIVTTTTTSAKDLSSSSSSSTTSLFSSTSFTNRTTIRSNNNNNNHHHYHHHPRNHIINAMRRR